jgi:hypothetical protein
VNEVNIGPGWFSPKSSNQRKHLQTMVFVVVQPKSE